MNLPRRPVIALLLLAAFIVRALAPGFIGVDDGMRNGGGHCQTAEAQQGGVDTTSHALTENKHRPAGDQRHDHANCMLCQFSGTTTSTLGVMPIRYLGAFWFDAPRPGPRPVFVYILNRGAPPRASPSFV